MSSLAKFYAERVAKKVHHYNVRIVVSPVNINDRGVGNATVLEGSLAPAAFEGDPDVLVKQLESIGYELHTAVNQQQAQPVVTEN